MAISKEDKHDVKTHLGKALAKKVGKVTNDKAMKAKGNMVTIFGRSMRVGSKKHQNAVADQKHYSDLSEYETNRK
jgi:hypothetical protein